MRTATCFIVLGLFLSVACAPPKEGEEPGALDASDVGVGSGTTGDSDSDTGDSDTGSGDPVGDASGWALPATEVGTLAGTGDLDTRDGLAEVAAFWEPKAVAFDQNGGLLVAQGDGAIRRISPDGLVTTLPIEAAALRNPSGLVVGPDGTVYISDADLDCIVAWADGESRVFAGVCEGSSELDGPRGLAWSREGLLLVADSANMRLQTVDSEGRVQVFAGSGEFSLPSEGPADSADLYMPHAVTQSANGEVWFSGMDHCLRRVADGMVEDVAGWCANFGNTGTADGAAVDARFDSPWALAVDHDDNLLVSDTMNDRIRVLSADRSEVWTLAGGEAGDVDGSLEEARFDFPRGIAVHADGWIAVADSGNHRIRVIQP